MRQSAKRVHFACAQNAHRTTARAIQPTQSAHRVHFALSKCAPTQSAAPATASACKLESTAPATKSTRKALKRCACHEIRTKSSKALRLSQKNHVTATCKALQMLRLPRNQTLTISHCARELARDCSPRMISTDFLQICSRENEPIVRQGQLKRRRRKHYHAPAKQDTSKQPPLDHKSYWHGNENKQPSKTLRLRSETTRRALKATIPARGQNK